ncbi:hypothetical protein UFOVP183_28 [uncultured Caudovirales phage]|uniref:Uncharacterized protein n=1 Tax=uncultured Caudovirales phage TaxID=2100421 RepID=A0A6J7WCJ5_9CAUD|nr:hypothetical protein UFOVP183_28 [uncultured Caudovirales phage]
MNTYEDDEFSRLEMESKVRKMAVQNALQKLHDENVSLGLYEDVYTSPIPLISDEEWQELNKDYP